MVCLKCARVYKTQLIRFRTNEWYGFKDEGMKWLKDHGTEWVKVCAEPGDLLICESHMF